MKISENAIPLTPNIDLIKVIRKEGNKSNRHYSFKDTIFAVEYIILSGTTLISQTKKGLHFVILLVIKTLKKLFSFFSICC
jgi:hypothetical protein